MHRVLIFAISVVALCLLSGCGAIFSGTTEEVSINSQPSNADIEINGQHRGSTPTTVTLSTDKSHTITLDKEGFSRQTVTVDHKLGVGFVVLDVLFTGLVGVVVDAATGGWYILTQNSVNVSLNEQTSTDLLHKRNRSNSGHGPVSRNHGRSTDDLAFN